MSQTATAPDAPLDYYALKPEVTEELLAEITRRIVESFHPHKVILFGSYAYGAPHRDSDLDLFVIMDSDERPAPRGIPVYNAAKVPFLPMDLLVRTPEEVEQRLQVGDHFVREVLEKGRVLYASDRA
jgi:uncharacterized protein